MCSPVLRGLNQGQGWSIFREVHPENLWFTSDDRKLTNSASWEVQRQPAQPSRKIEFDTSLSLRSIYDANTSTRAFSPTSAIKKLLQSIPGRGLKGTKVAAFDTRISMEDVDSRLLSLLVKLFGYAAEPIANKLKKKEGELAVPPEGFFVQGSEGPLKEGELERAAEWARQILGTQ